MKNIQKHVKRGLALTIMLFSLAHMSAMEQNRTVNPYLTEEYKHYFKNQIDINENLYQGTHDPKSKYYDKQRDPQERNYNAAQERAIIDAYTEIYYGNKPYTNEDIRATVLFYQLNATKVSLKEMK